ATIVAHYIELKIGKAFYSKRPPSLPRYPPTWVGGVAEDDEKAKVEEMQRKMRNEEFEKELRLWRSMKEVCPQPMARADVADLSQHLVYLEENGKLLKLFAGNMKDPILQFCKELVEEK